MSADIPDPVPAKWFELLYVLYYRTGDIWVEFQRTPQRIGITYFRRDYVTYCETVVTPWCRRLVAVGLIEHDDVSMSAPNRATACRLASEGRALFAEVPRRR